MLFDTSFKSRPRSECFDTKRCSMAGYRQIESSFIALLALAHCWQSSGNTNDDERDVDLLINVTIVA